MSRATVSAAALATTLLVGHVVTAANAEPALSRSIEVDGTTRSYLIDLPENYDPAIAYPVVLGFGGYGHHNTAFREYSKLRQATAGQAIVVYPEALPGTTGEPAWGGPNYALTTPEQETQAMRMIVNDVAAQHLIDPARVYAIGLSNGGGEALSLACHAPDLVAGVVAVAGAAYEPVVSDCIPANPVPTLLMHHADDPIIHFMGGTKDFGGTYLSQYQVLNQASQRNLCANLVSKPAIDGAMVLSGQGCAAETTLLTVVDPAQDNNGHTWFHNTDGGVIDAAETGWQFLFNGTLDNDTLDNGTLGTESETPVDAEAPVPAGDEQAQAPAEAKPVPTEDR